MSKITKPDVSIQWASAGTINTPSDVKKQTGWVSEKPAYEYMNWLQNRQDTSLAYLFQMGIPEWDSATEYQYSSSYATFIQYNGVVYKALQTGTNKNPASETAYWVKAFDDFGSASTVNSALTTHITNYGTLAALSNVTTARSNLSVYSIAQCDATFAPIAGNSAQTFLVGSASSANHAVRKSQFDAKTGQATETTAGIAEVATNAETLAGSSDTVVVTPLKLQYMIDNKGATTSAKGTVELATNAETITGTDTDRAVTPAGLQAKINTVVRPVAMFSATGGTKTADVLGNTTISSHSVDINNNVVYYTLAFSGLPGSLTNSGGSKNFVIVASGNVVPYAFSSLVSTNSIVVAGVYQNNAFDAATFKIEGVLYMEV